MEIRQLRYFVKIAEAGSLSKAAQILHVAQPALSHQMSQLEAELGQQLLLRRYDGVKVSEPGEVFYRHACRVLRDIDDLPHVVKHPSSQLAGTVSVGLPQCTASLLALPLYEALLCSHPGITLEFFDEVSSNLVGGVRNGKLDVAAMVSDDDALLVDSEPLMEEELFLVTRAPLGALAVPLSDLPGLKLALPGAGHPLRAQIEGAVRASCGVGLGTPVLVANSVNLLMRAVHSGLAATILPWGAISHAVAGGSASSVPLSPPLRRRVHLCTSAHGTPKLAALAVKEVLVNTVREQVTTHAWHGARLFGPVEA